MGLGSALLDGGRTTDALRGNGRASRIGDNGDADAASMLASLAGAVSGPFTDPGPSEEKVDADFVILWPALGCSQVTQAIGDKVAVEIIFLSKKKADEVNKDLVRKLLDSTTVMKFADARKPYIEEGSTWTLAGLALTSLAPAEGDIRIETKLPLDKYRKEIADRPQQFGELMHTISDIVPAAYLSKGFQSIVSVRLSLNKAKLTPGVMFTFFHAPENGLLRSILADQSILKKPYGDIPLSSFVGAPDQVHIGRGPDKNREHLVRSFHPFMVVPSDRGDYLHVGHVTDAHTSTLWDFFDQKVFPNYPRDLTTNTLGANREDADADSRFRLMSRRFNNPNLNLRSLIQAMNVRASGDRVDMILHTGDLIDFNRGFDHNPAHDPDKNYVYNLNWVRFYELLLLDYERPAFTLLGNHDWRLNPYPPRIKPEKVHALLMLYVNVMLAGTGLAVGTMLGAFLGAVGDDPTAGSITLLVLALVLSPLAASLSIFTFLSLLGSIGIDGDSTMDVLFSKLGLSLWLGGGYLLGLAIELIMIVVTAIRGKEIKNAGDGAVCGLVTGGGIGLIAAIIGLFMMFKERDYMTGITNLRGEDFDELLDRKNVGYLRAFGDDGVLHMTERAFDWYSLVINPFPDYAFKFGNMSFMMADWGGSEILTGDPPMADDTITDRQWKLLQNWIESVVNRANDLTAGGTTTTKKVVPILGMHTPVFCPMLDVDLDTLNKAVSSIGSDNLMRGTMEEHRSDIIKLFFNLGNGQHPPARVPIPALTLTGHTHTYDVFKMPDAKNVGWFQFADFKPGFGDQGLHVTTAPAGPPSDKRSPDSEGHTSQDQLKLRLPQFDTSHDNSFQGSEPGYRAGDRVTRPAGARVLKFDLQTGQIVLLDELSSPTAKWGDS